MKDLNYVAGEINKGKNLEINLPKFANSMMSLYNGLAHIKLSMNYYTYYEMLSDNSDKEAVKDIEELLEQLNIIIDKEIINTGEVSTVKESCCKVDDIRNSIIKVMEIVTAYVDRLRIYEYILNRVEFRFSDKEFDEKYYTTDLTNDLMHYIFSDKDNVVVNSKISEILGQLPMRLSKNKFYEHIRDAFSLYHGAQEGTVDDFVYALQTSAMLDEPNGFDKFKEVYELYKDLANADYKSINQEEFKSLSAKLHIASERMSDTADLYVILIQLVNDVYTILLSKMYAFNDVEEINNARYIIKTVKDGFDGKEYDADDNKIMDAFITFEGKQEKILASTTANDYIIDYVISNDGDILQSYMLDSVYNSLKLIGKLQSGSDFIELTNNESKLEIASDKYVDDTCNAFIEKLDNAFKNMPQIVSRAVMSTVLSQLPVFFNNIDEIQNYINVSLMQCSDRAEQTACVELMRILIDSQL